MKHIVLMALSILVFACSATIPDKKGAAEHKEAYSKYGYSKEEPIGLGGFLTDSKYEGFHKYYFKNLRGPNGEQVSVSRLNSCCGFIDQSLPFGGGVLDVYELRYEGQKRPVVIYVNLYRYENPKAPAGFTLIDVVL